MKSANFNYDNESDILYVSFAPGEKATSAVELNDHILLRLHLSERRAVGLTLMDFSVLAQVTELGPKNFPLIGLKELEPDWKEMVIDIITSPPINELLKVSVYAESPTDNIPIALVEKFPNVIAA